MFEVLYKDKMKITLDIESTILQPLIQESLDTGISVQDFVIGAIYIRNYLKKVDLDKNLVGYGLKDNFRRYNMELMEEHELKGALKGNVSE